MALRTGGLRLTGMVSESFLRPVGTQTSRWMSLQGIGRLPDKEKGEERVYFNKEEERLLRNLLSKVKKQADTSDVHAAEGSKAAELSSLKEIVGKYNMSIGDMEALIEWKHKGF